jgi:transcriptional regulator with XRE-family HTH domain
MRTTRSPRFDDVEHFIGQRVRACRLIRGMSQTQLGDAVGLTFQQIQKYEKGVDRIASSRLLQIASALGVTPGTFFPSPTNVNGVVPSDEMSMLVNRPDTIEMLRAFKGVTGLKRRAAAIELVKAFARV